MWYGGILMQMNRSLRLSQAMKAHPKQHSMVTMIPSYFNGLSYLVHVTPHFWHCLMKFLPSHHS